MTKRLLAAVILALSSFHMYALGGTVADAFAAEAEGTGKAILWFLGQEVTADVRAEITLAGTLVIAGTTLPFVVEAVAVGSGSGNMNTLAVDAWVAVRGEGRTEAGSLVAVEGGISVDALDPATSSTSGRGSGRFYLLITTPDGRWIVEGEAVGSATGSFVVPQDPNTMELEGAGSFTLSGELRPWTPGQATSLPDWPTKLLAELARQAALAASQPAK